MNLSNKRRVALLALMATAYPATVQAQAQTDGQAENGSASESGITDIIVTARKRSESLISVPVAVTAVTGDALQSTATSDMTKLDAVVPQMRLVEGNSGGGASFSIRGIGSGFSDSGLEQSVSVAIDGMQIGRGNIISQSFFDIAQIEVMKGPQALFFGKNSPAGVVSIKSNNPSDRLEGYVTAGYEFKADERYLEGAVSIPISDTLAIRLAGRGSGMEGYIRNLQGPTPFLYNNLLATPLTQPGAPDPRAPNSSSYAGRFTAVFSPTSNFTATLKAVASQYNDNGRAAGVHYVCFGPSQFLTVTFIGKTVVDPNVPCDGSRDWTTNFGQTPSQFVAGFPGLRDGKPYTDTKTKLVSLALEYDAGAFSVTSNSGYFHLDTQYSIFVGGTDAFLPAAIAEKNTTFSQEIRVASQFDGPINFTAGGYYEDYDDKESQLFADRLCRNGSGNGV